MAEVTLLYDGDCLLCQKFERYVALRQRHEVKILNAREQTELVEQLADQWYNINEGMILRVGDEIYVWAQAAVRLDTLIQGQWRMQRLLIWLSQQRCLVQLLYPIFKAVRVLIFQLQGRGWHKDIL
jgi:predicted DCC family thiol-disulfide oxidoreductase YuxK